MTLWASAAGASFHPVEDRPYRYETVETRTLDGAVLRFHASRIVVFHHTDSGFTASVTLEAVDQQAPGDVGRMFLTATGALLHRPIRYQIDAAGTVTHVEDGAAVIALIAETLERADPPDHARTGHFRAMASPLRALSEDRKVAMLSSILEPVIAGGAVDRVPGRLPVRVPSRAPVPSGMPLTGLETVSRSAGGIVTIDLRANGGVEAVAPAGAPGAAVARPVGPAATLHTIRNLDVASGLLRDSREISETIIRDGDTVRTTQIETVVTLTLAAT